MARCRWGFVLTALLLAVSCSSPTSAPAWRSFSSPEYGYSISYPPTWFDLGSEGAPASEHYFSNRKDLGSPVEMRPGDVSVEVSPDCQSGVSRNAMLISKSDMVVGGIPTTRYVVSASTIDGPVFMAVATVVKRPYCYRVLMLAKNQGAVESNLADFDRMLKSVRFSSRSTPAGSPVPTVAPGSQVLNWSRGDV